MFFPKEKSDVFIELARQYELMHTQGYTTSKDKEISAESAFSGDQLPIYIDLIADDFKQYGVKSFLDYGCGKAKPHFSPIIKCGEQLMTFPQALEIRDFGLFDAGVEEYMKLPERNFDAVLCNDVLEHIPVEDVHWVIDELFDKANTYVFASIAAYPAYAILPDGRNAHVTLRHPYWWYGIFEALSRAHKKHFTIVVVGLRTNDDGTSSPEPYRFSM